jgi:hypothetical protein
VEGSISFSSLTVNIKICNAAAFVVTLRLHQTHIRKYMTDYVAPLPRPSIYKPGRFAILPWSLLATYPICVVFSRIQRQKPHYRLKIHSSTEFIMGIIARKLKVS